MTIKIVLAYYAIDTNIYAAFKNNDAKVLDTLRNCDYIGVDVTVIAELLSGFKMGSREKANRAEPCSQICFRMVNSLRAVFMGLPFLVERS